jgi:hypothetical protein
MKAGWLCGLLALVFCCGCKGSDSSDSGGPTAAAGQSNNGGDTDSGSNTGSNPPGNTDASSDTIVASEGGNVVSGAAVLDIEANALTDDVAITVESSAPSNALPDRATIHGLIYDFGPDGTAFDPPALLTLPIVETPASDDQVVISWLDNGSWVNLETTVEGDNASALVEHFTSFAVRFLPQASLSHDASAPALPCPLGVWYADTAGPGTCDGGDGRAAFVITDGPGDTFLVAQDLTNIQTGPACDWEFSGSATFDGTTLHVDLVRDDNGCEKHALFSVAIDAACQLMTNPGDWTDVNCESCNANGGGCNGCGTTSCTSNYGESTMVRE